MAQYIMLLTLTPEGRQQILRDPDNLLRAESEINIPDVQTLGVYALLGDYDYACILSAPGNREAARFSLELGVKAGGADHDHAHHTAGQLRPPRSARKRPPRRPR